jgi:hypothetical protein
MTLQYVNMALLPKRALSISALAGRGPWVLKLKYCISGVGYPLWVVCSGGIVDGWVDGAMDDMTWHGYVCLNSQRVARWAARV